MGSSRQVGRITRHCSIYPLTLDHNTMKSLVLLLGLLIVSGPLVSAWWGDNDSDGDGIKDAEDDDDDNDGLLDVNDEDDDGDGILDEDEDLDGDGKTNAEDDDDDGDGILDGDEDD